ncbi:MAG: cardiolipin synthase, partial [Thermoanaerobaculia bacterium]
RTAAIFVMSIFRRKKAPRYPTRHPLPIVRRRLPMRYHMRHQFGVRDVAFLQTMHALTGAALSSGNHVTVLRNGVRIFPAMLSAVRAAQKTINLEFYIYWDGEIGRTFAEVLAERARAGVQVKVILDAVGSGGMSGTLVQFMQRNGIDIEWYHPLRWYTLSRVNHRTHRKLLVVDGEVGFSGGVGIADDWLGDADAKDHWRETVVRVEGPVVSQMQFAFMDNWVKSRGELLTGLDYFPQLPPRGSHIAQVIKSSPSEGSSTVKLMYVISIVAAQKSIYISNAYFVPDRDTIRALEGAVRRGVDVRVIVPGEQTDVPIVRQASRLHYDLLLRRGIRIFEYQPTMMHAKTMVVDGIWTTIGSSNFDDRSFRLNDEVNVNVYDEAIAKQVETMFFEDVARSTEITPRKWLRRTAFDRLKEAFAGVFKRQL